MPAEYMLMKGERKMCEANALILKDGKEELVMASVDVLRPEGEKIFIQDIFGEQRWVKARIKEMNLVHLLMAARKLTISAGEKVSQSAPVKKLTAMLFLPILRAQNPSTSCFSSFFTSPM